jgi:hypothetical protein
MTLRLPIRVRHAPAFVRQMWQRNQVLRRQPARQPTFRLCYFSCHSYFAYLYCALHSLTLAARDVKIEVLVFNDTDMPISEAQADVLRAMIPGLRVIPWPKSMGWGAEQIGWIWKAYALAAEGAHDDDIVARVDSDVFFFNDRIFRAVARSDADFIGDGHFVEFEYCQGGAYFLRASAVRQVLGLLQGADLPKMLAAADINVEDVAAQFFARQLGLRTWMTYFMMFPDELRNAGALTPYQRWKFSCLHFVMKNKKAMLEAYRREVLPRQQQEAFAALIATP